MPETIDSLKFTLVNDGTAPLDSAFALVPLPFCMLHTVKARLELGGSMANGKVIVFDGNPLTDGDEGLLYDSGVVAWTPSGSTVSVADALQPIMPITSNFAADPATGERLPGAVVVVSPTVATGAWTVVVRLTVSRG